MELELTLKLADVYLVCLLFIVDAALHVPGTVI